MSQYDPLKRKIVAAEEREINPTEFGTVSFYMKKSMLIIAMITANVSAYAVASDVSTAQSQNSEMNENVRLLSTMETLEQSSRLGLNQGEELSNRIGIRVATAVEASYFGIDIREASYWENRWFIYEHKGVTTVFRLEDIYKNSKSIIVNLNGSFSPIYDVGIQEYQKYSYADVFPGFEDPRVQLRIDRSGSYSLTIKGLKGGKLLDIETPRKGSIGISDSRIERRLNERAARNPLVVSPKEAVRKIEKR